MEPVRLTGTEWAVLDCLWEKAPQTMTQLARTLSAREGWAKGTTTTVLRRMTDKGLLACTQEGRARLSPPGGPGQRGAAHERRRPARGAEPGGAGRPLRHFEGTGGEPP